MSSLEEELKPYLTHNIYEVLLESSTSGNSGSSTFLQDASACVLVSEDNWMLRWGTHTSSLELHVVQYSELLFLIFARSSEDQDVYSTCAQQRVVFRNKQR